MPLNDFKLSVNEIAKNGGDNIAHAIKRWKNAFHEALHSIANIRCCMNVQYHQVSSLSFSQIVLLSLF